MIGIIAAMAEELAVLKQHLTHTETLIVGDFIFISGKIEHTEVVLLQCGIGKVNAAMGTTLLIDRFHPDYVINVGSAGGLHSELEIGDVIISIEVRYHDVDLTVWGYEHGQIPKSPAGFMPSEKLIQAAEDAALTMNMQVTRGLIISGDIFIQEEEHLKKLQKNFPKAHAVEMEGAAIAHACHQLKVPFVIIRALTDIAGKESTINNDLFLEQAAQHSTQLLLRMLPILKLNDCE